MKNATSEQQIDRLKADQEELARRIAGSLPHDGVLEPRRGLIFRRQSKLGQRVHSVGEPSFCVIAQGSKDILLGEEIFRYDPAHYLISTMELPLIGEVVEATPQRPYLSVRLVLDPSIVTSVMVEMGTAEPPRRRRQCGKCESAQR